MDIDFPHTHPQATAPPPSPLPSDSPLLCDPLAYDDLPLANHRKGSPVQLADNQVVYCHSHRMLYHVIYSHYLRPAVLIPVPHTKNVCGTGSPLLSRRWRLSPHHSEGRGDSVQFLRSKNWTLGGAEAAVFFCYYGQ